MTTCTSPSNGDGLRDRGTALTHTHTQLRLGLILMGLFLLASSVWSQTEWKDRYITLAGGTQKNPSIARATNGEYTVIVWEDYRNGSHSDIYCQKIENTNGIAQWFPIDGIPVCTASGEQRNPRVALDSLGGVFIAWEDHRSDTSATFDANTALGEIYCTRLDVMTGYVSAGWSGSIQVAGGFSARAQNLSLTGIGDGVYLVWSDTRDTTARPRANNFNVYAQLLLSTTASWPSGGNWVAGGICVHNIRDGRQTRPRFVLDSVRVGAGNRMGIVVAYEDNRYDNYQIFANRIDATGQRTWGTHDTRVATTTTNQQNVCLDQASVYTPGIGGGTTTRSVVLAWEDTRNYGSTGVDLYAQRVDLETAAKLWPGGTDTTGLCVTNASGDQYNAVLQVNGPHALVAWEDERNLGSSNLDIYANRITLATQSLLSAGGEAVCTEDGIQRSIGHSRNPGGDMGTCLLGWEDWRNDQADIYYQKYDLATFTAYQAENGWPVTLAARDQTQPQVADQLFVFTDARRTAMANDAQSDENIYAQKLGDECDAPTGMNWKDELAKWTLETTAQDHRFVTDGDGSNYVVWKEDREISTYAMDAKGIYVQKLDKDGVPRWLNDGVLVSDTIKETAVPDICIEPGGGALVTWQEGASNTWDVKVAKMNADGSIAWISTAECPSGSCTNPRITIDGAGGAYIAYEDANGIQVVQCYSDGSITPPEVLSDAIDPRIVDDGNGGCYVIGREGSILQFASWRNGMSMVLGYTPPLLHAIVAYDLARDVIQEQDGAYRALLAISDSANCYVTKIKSDSVQPELNPDISSSVIDQVSAPDKITHVSIASDSSDASDSNIGGKAIVAWNTRHTVGGVGTVHRLTVQHVDFQSGAVAPFWSGGLVLSDSCLDDTKPEIAWYGMAQDSTRYGVVVWQDTHTRWCTPNKAIVAQMVEFTVMDNPPSRPLLWGVGREVSPQLSPLDGMRQALPQVQRSMEGTVACFWLDARAGMDIIPGTRFHDCNESPTHDLEILKPNDQGVVAPSDPGIGEVYPQPWKPGMDLSITLAMREEGEVRMVLHDLLGRPVADLVDTWFTSGTHVIPVSSGLRARLAAGTYMVHSWIGGVHAQRIIIVQ